MPSAADVAKFLAYLAQSGEEADPLTNLRLQKLLYYVQGWSLANRGIPMFPDQIEAWAHGPVVPDVYRQLSQFKSEQFVYEHEGEPTDFNMTDDERTFVSEVWEGYKPYSALKLREMTHREEPWINARKGFGPADRCSVEITQEAMATFFTKLGQTE